MIRAETEETMRVYKKRITAENILIFLLGAIAVLAFAASFFPQTRMSAFFMNILAMKKMTARVFSVVLMVSLYHLYKRKRTAWFITVSLLVLNVIRHMIPPVQPVFAAVSVFETFSIAVLTVCRKDFCCISEKTSVKRGIFTALPVLAGILLNTGISYHFLKIQLAGERKRIIFWDSITEAFGILFGTTNNNAPGFPDERFENFMFWFSWICIFMTLSFILRPWIEKYLWNEKSMQRAREIVMKYGQNPASYLTLEDDKMLYFSKCAEGVLPYGVVGNTVIVNGDPVCAPEDFPEVLGEFREFCERSAHKLVFLTVTGRYLDEYIKQGFGTAKCGEEARFDLQKYDIAGKKGAKMRMNINHATNAGLTVYEYRPAEKRDIAVENAMNQITEEWLQDKKTGMLTFTLGSVGLDAPMDRRYFYAADDRGKIYGYNVYCPYDAGRGYTADITRRSHDAPGGITEKIMYEAFSIFKQEGTASASLGLAPLANVLQEGENANSIEKLLNFVYEHLNSCYGFKNLYRAKESYSPTEWLPGYYAWLPKVPDVQMFYAMVRIQNKRGLGEFISSIFPGKRRQLDRK